MKACLHVDLPKSANLSSPFSLMSKFCGFRSLWSTRLLWQYASPLSNWNKNIWKKSHIRNQTLLTNQAIWWQLLHCFNDSCGGYKYLKNNQYCRKNVLSLFSKTKCIFSLPCLAHDQKLKHKRLQQGFSCHQMTWCFEGYPQYQW